MKVSFFLEAFLHSLPYWRIGDRLHLFKSTCADFGAYRWHYGRNCHVLVKLPFFCLLLCRHKFATVLCTSKVPARPLCKLRRLYCRYEVPSNLRPIWFQTNVL